MAKLKKFAYLEHAWQYFEKGILKKRFILPYFKIINNCEVHQYISEIGTYYKLYIVTFYVNKFFYPHTNLVYNS